MTTKYRIRNRSIRQSPVRHVNRLAQWKKPPLLASMTLEQVAKASYGTVLARVVLSPDSAFIWVYQVMGRPNTLSGFNSVYTDNRRNHLIRLETRHYGGKGRFRCDTQVLIPATLIGTYYVDANVVNRQARSRPGKCHSARDVFRNLKPDGSRHDFGGGDLHHLSSFVAHNRVLTFDSAQKAIAAVQRAMRTNYYAEYVRDEQLLDEEDLYPYQVEAVDRLSSGYKINRISLAPGTGKTFQIEARAENAASLEEHEAAMGGINVEQELARTKR